MTAKQPSVGVIIPNYNRANLIVKTLDSLMKQTEPFDEIIVVDDASTDNSVTVLNEYKRQYPQIRLIRQARNQGAQAARNEGIRAAHSDFVILLDSDNYLTDNYVQTVKQFLREHPKVDVATHFSRIVDETGNKRGDTFRKITNGNILNDLLTEKTYVDNSAACIRRTKLAEIGYLDKHCPSFQEWDTHIRLAQVCEYGTIPEELTCYLEHGGARISSYANVMGRGLYVLKKHKKLWLEHTRAGYYKHLLMANYEKAVQTGNAVLSRKVMFAIWQIYPPTVKLFVKRLWKQKK